MIRLMPYCAVDGIPTLRDSDLGVLYERMQEDGTLRHVFYGGEVQSRNDLVRYFRNPANRLWVHLDEEGTYLGFCWINTLEGRSARLHYNAFSPERTS